MARIELLAIALGELTEQQLRLIESVVTQFRRPFITINRHCDSDIVDPRFPYDFGDVLRIHHCFSKEALSKDRFEYALLEIQRKTKQETRPGYCRVKDAERELKFELYFDAGSERKLQIRHLRKDLCKENAQWVFATE